MSPRTHTPRIGTAGWTIPRAVAESFPAAGSGLQRYAARFDAVEINSTFYRSHRPATYVRWVAATPPHFRFALKLPRTITHDARLVDAAPLAAAFRAEAVLLGDKLGPLLVQLPPSLAFAPAAAERFCRELRDLWPETIVWEPRHPSWFGPEADALLSAHRMARVAADPAPQRAAAAPGGWKGVRYWRLHGAPRMYFSPYEEAALRIVAREVRAGVSEAWCMFDNTASGAGAGDALRLRSLLSS
jgi:uncharacterized protein YecE (DUF72 family)